jgi:hypothetical protein
VAGGLFENAPNLLTQKPPARSFNAETYVTLNGTHGLSRSGLIVMGAKHAAMTVEEVGTSMKVSLYINNVSVETATLAKGTVRLRVSFADGGACRFSYATATGTFKAFTTSFQAVRSKWISAPVGLFSIAKDLSNAPGYADFSYFRFSARVFP